MTNQQKLQAIASQITQDNPCPELSAQATQLVPGSGNANADVVFIGEAPGKKEDQLGVPFVGAAGRFLDVMLDSIGLKREDIFITNIVKYRPPENRDPSTAEKTAFLPYLQRQLEVISPKVIVTLGRHSANCFLPDLQIGQDHGKAQKIQLSFTKPALNVTLLPLYHPAAALYNGSKRQTLLNDFALIPKLIS